MAKGKTKSDKDKKVKWGWLGPYIDKSSEMKALKKFAKSLTEDQRAKKLEKEDANVRGYFHGGKVKGYQGGGMVRRSPTGLGRVMGKAPGRPYLATNANEPINVRQRPGGMTKGGKVKGYGGGGKVKEKK